MYVCIICNGMLFQSTIILFLTSEMLQLSELIGIFVIVLGECNRLLPSTCNQ